MANLIIPFPEGTRTVVLRGKCITIGRLPENVIQVRDRTISAHHAELIWEEGHYRIHDVNSTNGILVNGQQVADYHLHEACQIQLGNLECQFRTEDPAAESPDDAETLPTRAEVTAVRQHNQQLKATVQTLREQMESMSSAREGTNGNGQHAQLDKLAAELAALKQENLRRQEEFEKLKDNFAVMRRDRENLQRAYESVNASLPTKNASKPTAAPAAGSGSNLAMPPRLPKPPISLGAATATPTAPSPTTPVRRPPSGIQPAPVPVPVTARAMPAAPAAAGTGPKGTEKLSE
jgi:pSer/pThr/pTyr-binding forkhead associated (FHA) protein